MHIVFIGYGKTSQRVAQHLFTQHQLSTISLSPKQDCFATHYCQDVHQLNLTHLPAIDVAYVLLSPQQSTVEAYQYSYVDSVEPIVNALKQHPIKRLIVVSSTRVYGENQGERIDDESEPQPVDAQGRLLLDMEQRWQAAYPNQCVIVRPTGIYGTSVARMIKLAENTQHYPQIHYSNRIHINDLAHFLAQLIDIGHPQKSYIVSNNQPLPLHQIMTWFQQRLGLPELVLQSDMLSGKRIYATHLQQMNFVLQHADCFTDYLKLLNKNPT